jgi:hypothetical protein
VRSSAIGRREIAWAHRRLRAIPRTTEFDARAEPNGLGLPGKHRGGRESVGAVMEAAGRDGSAIMERPSGEIEARWIETTDRIAM